MAAERGEAEPWEQQPGESAKAFAAFRAYRDLAAEKRSVPAAYTALTGRPCGVRGGNTRWREWHARNGWVARAAAWDREEDRLARAQVVKDAADAKRRRLREARWLQQEGLRRLSQLAASGESLPAAVALRMVEAGQNAERLEMGEATERTEAEVSAVSPEEAASRQAQVQALLRLMFPLAEEGEKIETGAPVGEGG
jgi:hypothetical protein